MPPPVRKQTPGKTAPAPGAGVLSRIQSIGFDQDEGIKVLCYGMSGTGKTTFWSTFPKPILSMVVSGGKKPGELRSIDTPENRKSIKTVVLEGAADVMDVVSHVRSTGSYRTLVLDHVTGFQDLVLSEIIGKPVPEQKSWGLASQQQYGQCTLQCKEVLRDLLSCTCNIVIVGQERIFKASEEPSESDAIAPTVGCNLMPQLGGWLNCAADYIVQTYKRNRVETKTVNIGGKPQTQETVTDDIEFCLRTGPDATYITKFRVPKGHALPRSVVDPTYDKIMSIIRGK